MTRGRGVIFLSNRHTYGGKLIAREANSNVFHLGNIKGTYGAVCHVAFGTGVTITANNAINAMSITLRRSKRALRGTITTIAPTTINSFFGISFSAFIIVPYNYYIAVSIRGASSKATVSMAGTGVVVSEITWKNGYCTRGWEGACKEALRNEKGGRGNKQQCCLN